MRVRLDHRDPNEPDIIAALERRRCLVQKLHGGDGEPDLLVGVPCGRGKRRFIALEVKKNTGPPSERALRASQVEWHELWAGAPVYVVQTVEEAIAATREPRPDAIRNRSHRLRRQIE